MASHKEGQDQAVLLVKIGRYVQYCWLAEENERGKHSDKELTEQELFHLWDQCNEAQFEDICVAAQGVLDDYSERKNLATLRRALGKRIKPVSWLVDFVAFCLREMVAGFVGAIGLLVFGVLLLWTQPGLVKEARTMLDKLLPESTQPSREEPVKAPANGTR